MVKYCGHCAFSEDNGNRMVCRRSPPQVDITPNHYISCHWPQVAFNDWCGEWKDKHMAVLEIYKAVPKTRKRGKPK